MGDEFDPAPVAVPRRIGALRFTEHRPADFWAERGYDWYAEL